MTGQKRRIIRRFEKIPIMETSIKWYEMIGAVPIEAARETRINKRSFLTAPLLFPSSGFKRMDSILGTIYTIAITAAKESWNDASKRAYGQIISMINPKLVLQNASLSAIWFELLLPWPNLSAFFVILIK